MNRLLAWRTAPAGTEPPGWQWVWQLEPQGPGSTEVKLTYDWSQVTDRALLAILENFQGTVPEVLHRYGAPAEVRPG